MKLFALLAFCACLNAQTMLTLADAEMTAVKNNPDVTGALLNAAAANQVTLEIHSASLPTAALNFTAAGSVPGSRLLAGNLNDSTISNRGASGVTASQLITDFGRNRLLTESYRSRARARAESAKAVRADVILQVDRAYFAALRATSLLAVARQTVSARADGIRPDTSFGERTVEERSGS